MLFKSINSNENQNHLKEDKAKITKLNNSNTNSTDEEISKLYYMFFNWKVEPKDLKKKLDKKYPNEWLLRFELYQNNHHLNNDWVKDLKNYLINYNKDNLDLNNAINRGLELI